MYVVIAYKFHCNCAGVAVRSQTCHPARPSCRGLESRTHAGDLRWEEMYVCTACIWALVCTIYTRVIVVRVYKSYNQYKSLHRGRSFPMKEHGLKFGS